MSEALELHEALVAKAVNQAIKDEHKKIITNLQLAGYGCLDATIRFCKMCEKTGTNPWRNGCCMKPIIQIIKGETK